MGINRSPAHLSIKSMDALSTSFAHFSYYHATF